MRQAAAAVLVALASGLPALFLGAALPLAARAEATVAALAGSEQLLPGLYRIEGAHGATLLLQSAQGLIVVDPQRAGSDGALMAAARRISQAADPPVLAVFLTAAGPAPAGAPFAAAGVPVIVQQRAAARLPAAARGPLVTYESDYLLRAGTAEVEAEYVGSGRSGADSVVLFRDLRVLAVGDLFTTGTPEPERSSGGSYAGWAAAIGHLLWLDFDHAIASRGAPVGRAELAAFKARLEAMASRDRPPH